MRAGLSAVILLLVGTMIDAIPTYASAWMIAALSAAFVLSHGRHYLQGRIRIVLFVTIVGVVIGCLFMSIRAYRGANFHLKYRVCGTPQLVNGLLESVIVGTEWVNNNGEDVYIVTESHSLSAGDRSSVLPEGKDAVILHPSGLPADDAKLTDVVEFEPPIFPPKGLRGHIRSVFKFGADRESLTRPIIVEGTFEVLFTSGADRQSFRFTPTKDGTAGYIGSCEIGQQVRGQTTSNL